MVLRQACVLREKCVQPAVLAGAENCGARNEGRFLTRKLGAKRRPPTVGGRHLVPRFWPGKRPPKRKPKLSQSGASNRRICRHRACVSLEHTIATSAPPILEDLCRGTCKGSTQNSSVLRNTLACVTKTKCPNAERHECQQSSAFHKPRIAAGINHMHQMVLKDPVSECLSMHPGQTAVPHSAALSPNE